MIDTFRVNSSVHSWESCSFRIDLLPISTGMKAWSFKDSRERPPVRGGRRDGRPVGKPSGKYAAEPMKFVCLRDTADAITTYLTAKGLGSYGDAEFTMMFQAFEEKPSGVGAPLLWIMAESCTIDGVAEDQDAETNELVTEFTIGTLQLTRNGKTLWSVARQLTI